MRRALVLSLVTAVLVVPAALAGTTRERTTPGPLSAVSIAGTEVAYADEYRRGCHEVRLWDVASRADRRVSSHCFVSTSTGSGVAAVEATGGRSVWVTFTGGNIREWSLWTKGSGSKVKRISFLPADVDGPPPVVLGRPWEGSLPYAIGRTVIVLAPNGSRLFTLTAPDRVVALSAHSRGYAAVLANSHVLSISREGRLLRDHSFPAGGVQDAVLAAPGLVAKTPDGIEIRNGDSIRKVPLPRSSRFLGYSDGIVAYGLGRQLRLKRLANAHDVLYRTLAPRFNAQLGQRGLVYASGRTLGFSVWAIVAGSV